MQPSRTKAPSFFTQFPAPAAVSTCAPTVLKFFHQTKWVILLFYHFFIEISASWKIPSHKKSPYLLEFALQFVEKKLCWSTLNYSLLSFPSSNYHSKDRCCYCWQLFLIRFHLDMSATEFASTFIAGALGGAGCVACGQPFDTGFCKTEINKD